MKRIFVGLFLLTSCSIFARTTQVGACSTNQLTSFTTHMINAMQSCLTNTTACAKTQDDICRLNGLIAVLKNPRQLVMQANLCENAWYFCHPAKGEEQKDIEILNDIKINDDIKNAAPGCAPKKVPFELKRTDCNAIFEDLKTSAANNSTH